MAERVIVQQKEQRVSVEQFEEKTVVRLNETRVTVKSVEAVKVPLPEGEQDFMMDLALLYNITKL